MPIREEASVWVQPKAESVCVFGVFAGGQDHAGIGNGQTDDSYQFPEISVADFSFGINWLRGVFSAGSMRGNEIVCGPMPNIFPIQVRGGATPSPQISSP